MSTDAGKLVLRLTLGLMMLFHGWDKIIGGVDGIAGLFQNSGFPGFFAYLVFVGEILAPLFLIAGAYTRVAAVLIAGNMVIAVLLVHVDDIFALSGTGGWAIELQAFYLMTAVVIFLLGPGKLSFMPESRWN
jgi:putative oxidoreductase